MPHLKTQPSTLIYAKRKIGEIIHNKRKISKVVLNGVVIWDKNYGYIFADDTVINLSERNQYTQETILHTNRNFNIK